jgi:hypothetical protein
LSSLKSRPSTRTPVPKATCSFSLWWSDVAVERHHPDGQRELVLRPGLGVVERVEVQLGVLVVAHDLDVELPARVVAALDRLVQVPGGRAELVRLDRGGLRVGQRRDALLGLPVVLHEHADARGVDHAVGVDAEAVHVPVVGRDAARAEQPGQHVYGLGGRGHEVEDPVGLLAERDRVRLQRVDHVGELDRVPDEEDRQVVADQVPVAVVGAELHGEAARVAGDLRGVAATDHRGVADRDRGALAALGEQLGSGEGARGLVADRPVRRELAVGHEAPGVHHPLRDPLPVEVADLLEELVVLQGRRSPAADRALLLVVVHRMTLAGGQHRFAVSGLHGSVAPLLAPRVVRGRSVGSSDSTKPTKLE